MRRGRDAGFTLVEMLVSLAILGMAATMLLAGLQRVGTFGSRTAIRADRDDTIDAAQRALRVRIEALRPLADRNSATPIVDASGDAQTFSFIAPPLARSEPDALWRYRIAATRGGDLVLYAANLLDERYNFLESGVLGWRPEVVLKNVAGIDIDYFGERRTGPGAAWQVTWIQRPQPPTLVRIRVTFRAGDPRQWPDLIIRPRATANTACRIDPMTGRCGTVS